MQNSFAICNISDTSSEPISQHHYTLVGFTKILSGVPRYWANRNLSFIITWIALHFIIVTGFSLPLKIHRLNFYFVAFALAIRVYGRSKVSPCNDHAVRIVNGHSPFSYTRALEIFLIFTSFPKSTNVRKGREYGLLGSYPDHVIDPVCQRRVKTSFAIVKF